MTTTFRASHRFAPMSGRKARLVVDLVRGADVNTALENLQYLNKRGATLLMKVIRSAVANAAQEGGVELKELYLMTARVNDGPLKQHHIRWRPGPMGRSMPIRKRTCHIEVVLGVRKETGAQRRKPSVEESKGGEH